MSNTSFQNLFKIKHGVEVRINVTNACNLHCDFCDHDAHLPFDRYSSKILRQTPMVASSEALEKFCKALSGVGEDECHVLQGGEITVLPVKLIERLIETLYSFGRRIGMRTNGYNITSIPLDSLNRLEFIYLNAHGNNQEAIKHCLNFLVKNYNGQIINEENFYHRNLSVYVNHGQGTIEQGLNCNHMLSTLTYLPPIIHPCCNSWALMNTLNNTQMGEQLIKAGWTSDNLDLKNTLANWRETLPKPFLETFCANSCYLTAPDKMVPLQQIQSHHLDKVLKK
ncbi:MAG: hypothetical protein PHY54_11115 [Methylococcales bacterium]|nr:hypothetical protein [Methylococcales bacterium]